MPSPRARSIAVFGTASDVGKSVVAAGLCRHLSDLGHVVAPFKAQNMSNNSGVTRDGKEMGRAQIVQALCARAEPHVDMNPVLLKPSSDRESQVVLLGEPSGTRGAREYFEGGARPREVALGALERLQSRFDVLVIEGAGSCAEVNLRPYDFVNFPTAHAADARVVLVADIDRGGVFAQLVGTLDILAPEDRARVAGVLINRFRGDVSLFDDGRAWLETRTGVPILGVVPYLPDLDVESEDAVVLEREPQGGGRAPEDDTAWIAVLRLPHISNFTDFDALGRSPRATLHYLTELRDLSDYDLVILPGTKAVRADLEWLHAAGWSTLLSAYAQRGGRVAGICGGYQMLGRTIRDPEGVEGPPGEAPGLGLLDVATTFAPEKQLRRVRGQWMDSSAFIEGYEIHMGATERGADAPAAMLTAEPTAGEAIASPPYTDGARSRDGRVFGTYVHGLFDAEAFRDALLTALGAAPREESGRGREAAYDRLAEHLRIHVDVRAIEALLEPR